MISSSSLLRQIDVSLDQVEYPVYIGRGIISQMGVLIRKKTNDTKVMIVVDSFLRSLVESIVEPSLKSEGFVVFIYYLEGGKQNKTIHQVLKVYGVLEENEFSRDSVLIAIGGGVCGDLAGFVSSTYLRGIYLVHVPTTLMGMVDSSIGGKVAINFRRTINALGNYYHPILNIMDLDFILSLSDRDYRSGLAEVIKCAFISDKEYIKFLIDNSEDILDPSGEAIDDVIEKTIATKISFVTGDIREGSKRLKLNYGHTIGHAIEVSTQNETMETYKHGEGVSLGMVAVAYLAKEYFGLNDDILNLHIDVLSMFNLPTEINAKIIGKTRDQLFNNCLENVYKDKKRKDNNLRFILVKSLGSSEIVTDITMDSIAKVFEKIIK